MQFSGWRRRPALACLVLCLFVFALLAWQVQAAGALVHLDLSVTLWLAAHRTAPLTGAMRVVSAVHESGVVLAATAVLAMALLVKRRKGRAMMLAAVPFGIVMNVLVKNVFERARPVLHEPLVHYAASSYSFPSGHATAATLFYGSLCLLAWERWSRSGPRIASVVAAAAMVALVCFSRVYLGAHFLSDVVAGAVLSAAWLAAFEFALQASRPRRPGSGGAAAD